MTPSEAGTKPGQTEPGKTPGIRLRTEERYHHAPWQLRLYHNGKESYTFHASIEEALKAKAKAERLKKKEGARALGYDRAAQLEYEEAKRILGPGANLVELARQMAARVASGYVAKKVPEAVEEYLAIKVALRRSRKHVQDIRQRLSRFADAFCDRDIETITRADVLGFVLGLKRDDESGALGLAPRTLWNFYGLIASLFHHAHREGWVENNPCAKIDPDTDLPAKSKGMVEVLTPQQGKAIMRQIEQHEPLYVGWACLQYFLGVRDAEAERFRGEWLQRKERRVVIPGWTLDGDIAEPVTKTRDDWVIDKVPPAFWDWMVRYPEAFTSGPIAYPNAPAWARMRDAVIGAGQLDRWPRNGFRHSFATYHLSWLRDAQATSFILRHRSPQKLWDSYFARFVSKAEGKRYLSLQPLP